MSLDFAGLAQSEREEFASEEERRKVEEERREVAERAGKAAAAKVAALAAASKLAMLADEEDDDPPPAAERLLAYLVTPKRLEETVGDFAEAFALMRERHGTVHARRWYYWQVFMIVARNAVYAVHKAAKLWGDFGSA